MVDTTLINKISLVYKFLSDNSFIGLILLLILVIVMDLMYGKNKKETKILYLVIILLMVIFILLSYYKPFINIIDVYISNAFRLAYFPSIIEYFSMILITVIIQIVSFRKCNKVLKNINLWIGLVIECLFIVNVVAMNGVTVDLNTVTSIYENDLLLSLFQLTGIIFMLSLIMNLLVYIVSSFLETKIEMPKIREDYYE